MPTVDLDYSAFEMLPGVVNSKVIQPPSRRNSPEMAPRQYNGDNTSFFCLEPLPAAKVMKLDEFQAANHHYVHHQVQQPTYHQPNFHNAPHYSLRQPQHQQHASRTPPFKPRASPNPRLGWLQSDSRTAFINDHKIADDMLNGNGDKGKFVFNSHRKPRKDKKKDRKNNSHGHNNSRSWNMPWTKNSDSGSLHHTKNQHGPSFFAGRRHSC